MESASSFYITLPSNACKDIYPENTAQEYKTQLVRSIHLSHQYEVALVQLQFPHSWHSLSEDDSYYTYKAATRPIHVKIPHGFYLNAEQSSQHQSLGIVNALNNGFRKAEEEEGSESHTSIQFQYNAHDNKVELYLKNDYILFLPKAIAEMLGFECPGRRRTFTEQNERIVAEHSVDLQRGFHSLYIYCNLCTPQFVGDAYVPLLRIVDNKGKPGEIVMTDIEHPHYVPLSVKSFNTIEINIKNDANEFVSFTSGKVMCKLHFRIRK